MPGDWGAPFWWRHTKSCTYRLASNRKSCILPVIFSLSCPQEKTETNTDVCIHKVPLRSDYWQLVIGNSLLNLSIRLWENSFTFHRCVVAVPRSGPADWRCLCWPQTQRFNSDPDSIRRWSTGGPPSVARPNGKLHMRGRLTHWHPWHNYGVNILQWFQINTQRAEDILGIDWASERWHNCDMVFLGRSHSQNGIIFSEYSVKYLLGLSDWINIENHNMDHSVRMGSANLKAWFSLAARIRRMIPAWKWWWKTNCNTISRILPFWTTILISLFLHVFSWWWISH